MKSREFLEEKGINVEASLELLGDMEMYNETLQDFLTESETRIPSMKNYMDSNDMPNYAILAHSMKSDSKYLGFTKLAEMSLEHELKAKENNVEFVRQNYDSLINEADKIISIVKEYLGE